MATDDVFLTLAEAADELKIPRGRASLLVAGENPGAPTGKRIVRIPRSDRAIGGSRFALMDKAPRNAERNIKPARPSFARTAGGGKRSSMDCTFSLGCQRQSPIWQQSTTKVSWSNWSRTTRMNVGDRPAKRQRIALRAPDSERIRLARLPRNCSACRSANASRGT